MTEDNWSLALTVKVVNDMWAVSDIRIMRIVKSGGNPGYCTYHMQNTKFKFVDILLMAQLVFISSGVWKTS